MMTFDSAAALRRHYDQVRAKFFPIREVISFPPPRPVDATPAQGPATVTVMKTDPADIDALIEGLPPMAETDARILTLWGRLHCLERTTGRSPSAHFVQRVVANAYGMSVRDLLGPRRHTSIVTPRHIAMFLLHHLTLLSLPQIGRAFGGRDHTTVIHALRKFAHLNHYGQAFDIHPEPEGLVPDAAGGDAAAAPLSASA